MNAIKSVVLKKLFISVFIIISGIVYAQDTTPPTVILSDTDIDNQLNITSIVTITAVFSESMMATPTISISGLVTDALMTPQAGTTTWTYFWDVSSTSPSTSAYTATVSGTDLASNAYSGTDSITFNVTASCPSPAVASTPALLNPSDPVSATNPYLITNLNELLWLAEDTNAGNSAAGDYFILTQDIDASSTQYWDDSDDDGNGNKYDDINDCLPAGNNEGSLVIGNSTSSNIFRGNFDGRDYTIDGLYIDRTNIQRAAFIGTAQGSILNNVRLTSIDFSSGHSH